MKKPILEKVAIIGTWQSGLQLGLGFLASGQCEVTLISGKSTRELLPSGIRLVTIQFAPSVRLEEILGLTFWKEQAFSKVEGV
ncbi:MAG TPA: hypothetical protein DCE41_18880 [Cytophagales bacterium]|nr:hypothetical protein [Cytophagales bacterium]HAA22943.1 hypothetical protein [Cytophagales bacterium]HAP62597.1 hypothetical protein [Cytophagales bacterium]